MPSNHQRTSQTGVTITPSGYLLGFCFSALSYDRTALVSSGVKQVFLIWWCF